MLKFNLWIKTIVTVIALVIANIAFAETTTATNNSGNDSFSPQQQKAIENIIHNYLVNNPQVLVEAATALQKQQQTQWQKTATKVVPATAQQLFANPISPTIGNQAGDVTVVEFFDYQCPHCKEMEPQITDLLKQDKNLRVVYKALPIFGDNSEFAAKASIAAVKQGKFFAFHDAMLNLTTSLTPDIILNVAQQVGLNTKQLKTDMQSSAIQQELKDNYQLAKELKLVGTPGFVIAKTTFDSKTKKLTEVKNPILIPGAVDEATLTQAISQARNGDEQQ